MNKIDLTIIVIYLGITLYLGIRFRGRQDSADDYFTASGALGGRIGSILVGLSVAATLFSGISFIGTPSLSYRAGLISVLVPLCLPILWLIVTFWFLPKYLAHKGTHPYDFIEKQFGFPVRITAAAFFVLLRIGWMAALIYVPTLVVMAAAGLDDQWFWPLVLVVGFTCTAYTTAGGIRGVVITDALQFVIIAIGILMIIGYILFNMPAGFSEIVTELDKDGYLEIHDWSFDFTKTLTVWSIFFGIVIANLSAYAADQMSLQRYLATGTLKSAQHSFTVNAITGTCVQLLLILLGIALAAWYRFNHDPTLPEMPDKVLPHFIATVLPTGLSGLIIAAILAATMSSMTSGINSLAGSITNDLRQRVGQKLTPNQLLRFARRTSLIIGLLSTLSAGLVSALGTIFDIAMILFGIFLGPLLTPVFLAACKVIAPSWAVICGMFAGFLTGCLVAWSPASSLWVAPAAFFASLIPPLIIKILPSRNAEKLLESPQTQ